MCNNRTVHLLEHRFFSQYLIIFSVINTWLTNQFLHNILKKFTSKLIFRCRMKLSPPLKLQQDVNDDVHTVRQSLNEQPKMWKYSKIRFLRGLVMLWFLFTRSEMYFRFTNCLIFIFNWSACIQLVTMRAVILCSSSN